MTNKIITISREFGSGGRTIGKLLADVLGITQVRDLLEGVGTVMSTLLAIVLCIMSVYIISTALVLLMGGGGV